MKKAIIIAFAAAIAASSPSYALTIVSKSMPRAIFENVIMRDISSTQKAAEQLKHALNTYQQESDTSVIDDAFTALVKSWKALQTIYVAGELNPDLIDTPRLIDTFHNGKEDLFKKLSRVVTSNEEAQYALFKNTYKSINALAFYLYADTTINDTDKAYAIFTVDTLIRHFKDIEQGYQAHKDDFLEDSNISMSYLLNALIDSSYKLKEWRIGGPAGMSRKYEGEPDRRRQEYPYSHKSLEAFAAILAVHDDLMGEREFANLGSDAIAAGAEKEVQDIRTLIHTAQKYVTELQEMQKSQEISFDSETMKKLFDTVGDLNDAYYQSLIAALPVQAKILDADGD